VFHIKFEISCNIGPIGKIYMRVIAEVDSVKLARHRKQSCYFTLQEFGVNECRFLWFVYFFCFSFAQGHCCVYHHHLIM
jgi:hypothetical protein